MQHAIETIASRHTAKVASNFPTARESCETYRVPARSGSLTYLRLFVDGQAPDDFRDKYMRSIRLRTMKPLDPDGEEVERSGWCQMGQPFELDLSYEDAFYNEFLNLGLRTDKWQIPASMLKQRLREAEAAYLQKKGRERLGRAEKTELKESVVKKIRREIAPTTRQVDVSWAMNEGIVRFFSHSDKTAAVMSELFFKTFGLKLIPESPYTLATRLGLSKAQESAWDRAECVSFAPEEA
jgi:hypothetical protein